MDFDDLRKAKNDVEDTLKLERDASKVKDEIIKQQDAKILEFEVDICLFKCTLKYEFK